MFGTRSVDELVSSYQDDVAKLRDKLANTISLRIDFAASKIKDVNKTVEDLNIRRVELEQEVAVASAALDNVIGRKV